jgi:mRNA interferase RelE/StbE
MSCATQVYDTVFDRRFSKLPADVRSFIEAKIDEMSLHLGSFYHYQLTGGTSFRLRVGDYRVIYEFDLDKNEIYLLTVGHRREIYR